MPRAAPIARVPLSFSLGAGAVALLGTGLVAAFVSIGNVLGRLYYDVLKSGQPVLAASIAGGVVASVCCIVMLVYTCRTRRVRA